MRYQDTAKKMIPYLILLLGSVVVTTMSSILAFFASTPILTFVLPSSSNLEINPTSEFLAILVFILCVITLSSTGQFLLLRRTYPALPIGHWLLAGVLAGLALSIAISIPMIPITSLPELLQILVPGIVVGAVIGIAQWYVLRRYALASEWWISISMLTWIASSSLIKFIIEIITVSPDM